MGDMTADQLPPGGKIPPLTLGYRLQISMQDSGVSRAQMADYLGVNPATISRWMHDDWKRPPSRGNLLAWATLCKVPADWLIDGDGDMPTPPAFPRLVTGSDTPASPRARKSAKRRNKVYCSIGSRDKVAVASAA